MNCDWEYISEADERGRRVVRCRREGCGIQVPTKSPLEKVHAQCRSPLAGPAPAMPAFTALRNTRTPCRYLGPELRQVDCPSCGGRVRIKIFACEVFGECSLGKLIPRTKACDGCQKYEASGIV